MNVMNFDGSPVLTKGTSNFKLVDRQSSTDIAYRRIHIG